MQFAGGIFEISIALMKLLAIRNMSAHCQEYNLAPGSSEETAHRQRLVGQLIPPPNIKKP